MSAAVARSTSAASGATVGVDLAVPHVHLEANVGDIASGKVQVINTGSATLQYEWVPVARRPLSSKQHAASGVFHLLETRGFLRPFEQHEFTVAFCSHKAGVFRQEWELQTVPALPSRVSFSVRAFAIEADPLAAERYAVEEHLRRNMVLHTAQEMVERIVSGVRTPPQTVASQQRAFDARAAVFQTKNEGLSVHFTPELWTLLERIYYDARGSGPWDGSVRAVQSAVEAVPSEPDREPLRTRLAAALSLGAYAPPRRGEALLPTVAFRLLCDVGEGVADAALALVAELAPAPPAAADEPPGGKKPPAGKAPAKPGKGAVPEPAAPAVPTVPPELKEKYLAALHEKVAALVSAAADRFEMMVSGEADLARLQLRSALLPE